MRNNKMKGFTLVELLVVIAILAILATVSVVGYTSFIESATVSNDENVAAQLNHFLVAYNQQNFGSPTTDKINEDNIRDITADILADGGLESLMPQAEKYGYHFYYDLKANEYVVLHDDKAMGLESGLTALIKAFAEDEAEEETFVKRVGNSFTVGGRYFLVDTDGLYGSLINSVYDFNGNKDDLALLYTETVANFTSTDGVALGTAIQKAMEDIVYITDSGTFVISVADTHTLPIANVTEGETVVNITNIKTDITGATSSVTQDAPLASVSGNVTIELPGNVKIFGDSLNITVEAGASVTIVINADSWNDIQMDAGFTNSNVVIELNGVEHTLQNDKIVNDKNETVKENLTYSNPMKEFDLLIQDLSNKKVHTVINTGNSNNVGYMAWNEGKIILQPTEIVGNDGSSAVSSTGVVLSVDDSVKDYVTITNNVITIKDINNDGTIDRADYLAFAEMFESFTVTAKSVVNAAGERVDAGVDAISATATVKVVKVAGASLSMKGDSRAWTQGSTVLLTYDKDSEKQYTVSVFGSTYNHPEAKTEGYIELDEAISLSTLCNDPACCVHKLGHTNEQHITDANAEGYCKAETHTHTSDCCTKWHTHSSGCNSEKCTRYKEFHDAYCTNCTHTHTAERGDENMCCQSHKMVSTCASNNYVCCDHIVDFYNAHYCTHVHTTQTDCISCLGNHKNLTINGASVTTTGEGKFVLTVTVDNLTIEKLVNISVMDFSNIPVRVNPAFANTEIRLGNLNSITAGDLFTTRSGETYASAGYILKIYEGIDANGNPILVDITGADGVAATDFSVNNNSIVLSNGLTDTIQFANVTGNQPVKMALFLPDGTTRISDEYTVHVVNATNIKSYAELDALINKEEKDKDGNLTNAYKLTTSVVLLNNIAMDSNGEWDIPMVPAYSGNHFRIESGKALYGNYFTIDVKYGRQSDAGIIDLNGGLIRDVRIIGAVYPDFAGSVSLKYGSAVVSATGNGTIENCYIANARSAVRINSGTVTIKDTVLFGGRYANIDMVGGTLKVQGTVTTVQQEYNGVIGVGIAGWFNDGQKSIILEDITVGTQTIEADLVQYNFLSSTMANSNKLPTISFLGTDILDLNTPFKDLFNSANAAKYGTYIFTDANGVQYANATMVATDKYYLSYEASNSDSTVTITMKPGVSASNISFDIVYDSSKYSEVGAEGRADTTLNDGVMHITGATLSSSSSSYATYTFTLNSGSFDKFDFKVCNVKDGDGLDTFKTLNVDSTLGYSAIDYNFAKVLPLSSTDSINNYYSKGIRYNQISAEVYTVTQSNVTYQQRLNEYLAMGNYYTPEGAGSQFGTTSGTLTNYWETTTQQ